MYTQCPHCQTCFRIAEDHLRIAGGKVRCGSCQEVFDATQYLFKNLIDREPIKFDPKPAAVKSAPPKPAPKPAEPPAPVANTKDKDLLAERRKSPAQDKFMESVVGNDRYNDLDNMHKVEIPGSIDFGDSFIKSADESPEPAESLKLPPKSIDTEDFEDLDLDIGQNSISAEFTIDDSTDLEPKKPASARTEYEDTEARDKPATEAEREILKNFFAEVDAQLLEGETRTQLDQDIDELLAFTKGANREQQAEPPDIEQVSEDATADTDEHFTALALSDIEHEPENADADKSDTAPVASTAPEPAPATDKRSARDKKAQADDSHKTATRPDKTIRQHTDETAELDDDVPHVLRRSLEELKNTRRRSLGMSLLMFLLIILLIGGLGFQVLLFRNVELAQAYPKLIPELTKFCSELPCRYSGKVDVSQIKLLNRDVTSDPKQPNALQISATFVDQAPFDQPYPDIQITLYDLGGNVVASRRFTPKEYLQGMYNRFLLMESGTPVHITLAVLDPGKDAINFEFSFL